MTNGKHWEDHIDSLIREANGGYIGSGLNQARWEICWMKINPGLLLLVTDGPFLVPILHHQVFSVDCQPFVFEEDLRDGIAIDFEIEVVVGIVESEWPGSNRVDWHLEVDCTSIGNIWKYSRTVGSCRRLKMLVSRVK